MKKILHGLALFLLAVAAIAATGCVNISSLAKEMAKSDATIVLNISTIYGTSKFVRTNPRAGQTATISPDGTVTVSEK